MNSLKKDLIKLTEGIENAAFMKRKEHADRFRGKIHLAPPTGWLNDPNGLCQMNGVYHAFFQYSPFDVNGGLKMWGHYTSPDMIRWNYQGVSLYPDQPFDCHGVYSGSAYTENGKMYLYYTGNVKLEDGNYDYIHTGREANTVLVTSGDGIHFGQKRELMRNADYPPDLTLHVRDPKVWKEGETYYMLQGARTEKDIGEALIFESKDRIHWKFRSRVQTESPFGYMWECPDYFTVDETRIFSASVQGLTGEKWADRNVYQSGYFLVEGDLLGKYSMSDYYLWDYGFDYYAPQSFETEDGRRIQIGWMGMPDCEEYTNHTIKDGWQHCFTFPREIYRKDGKICQRPVRELKEKRRAVKTEKGRFISEGFPVCEICVSDIRNSRFLARLSDELILEFRDGKFEMRFTDPSRNAVSAGRGKRCQSMDKVEDVRILIDVSSAEVFVNEGRFVFSTRYYPKNYKICVEAEEAEITVYEIKP